MPTRARLSGRRLFLKDALKWTALALALPGGGVSCYPAPALSPTPASGPAEPATAVPPTSTPAADAAPSPPTPVVASAYTPPAAPTPRVGTLAGELRLATNHSPVEVPWFKKVLAGFAQRQPGLKVEHTNVASRYLEQVPAWAADGNLPDVLFVRSQHAAAWAYRKWLVGVDDLVQRDAREIDLDDFYPPQVQELKYQDKWLALPYDYSVYGLYYRADQFSEAGVERPSDDWTWPDLAATATRLTKREGGQVARWGFDWRPDCAAMPGIWLAEGGTFLAEDRQGIAVAGPENVRATQRLADLSQVDGVAPRPADAPPGSSLFAAGRLAIEGNGSWAAALYRSASGGKARLDVAYVPRGAAGHRAVQSTGSGWAIGRGARQRDLAWELLKHLASRDSIELLVALPVRNLPGRVSATGLWLDSLRAIGAPAHPEVFSKTAAESYPLRPAPWWLDYEDAYADLMPKVWSGEKKAAEVLPELEKRVNAAAARFT